MSKFNKQPWIEKSKRTFHQIIHLKKENKKKEFIEDYILNNLLKLFLHKAFYERTSYFDHFPLSSIYI